MDSIAMSSSTLSLASSSFYARRLPRPVNFRLAISRSSIGPIHQKFPRHISRSLALRSRPVCQSKCSSPDSSPDQPFSEFHNIDSCLKSLSETVFAVLPPPIKEFPWKKATSHAFQHLIQISSIILKRSIVCTFIFSFLSDSYLTILRDKELIIPVGLSLGCAIANLLKETILEFKQDREEKKFHRDLVIAIGASFVLLKFLSRGNMFVSHLFNGGLMQVLLWLAPRVQEPPALDESTGEPSAPLSSEHGEVLKAQ